MKVNNLKTVIFYRVNYKFFVESEGRQNSVAMHLDKRYMRLFVIITSFVKFEIKLYSLDIGEFENTNVILYLLLSCLLQI